MPFRMTIGNSPNMVLLNLCPGCFFCTGLTDIFYILYKHVKNTHQSETLTCEPLSGSPTLSPFNLL